MNKWSTEHFYDSETVLYGSGKHVIYSSKPIDMYTQSEPYYNL